MNENTLERPVTTFASRLLIERRHALLVGAVILITCLPYIGRLGFYNDDWFVMAAYENAHPKNLWSLMLADGERMRPAKVAYYALLYWLFRDSAFGYHLTNALVLALACGLFNALLRKAGVPERDALALALVWGTLPHAATGRFWFNDFQMFGSIALLFLAALAELTYLDRRHSRWRVLAISAAIVSALLYEIALPLFLLIPFLVVRQARIKSRRLTRGDKLALLVYPVTVALLVPLKLLTTTRLEGGAPAAFGRWFVSNVRSLFAIQSDSTVWGFNVWRALDISFVELGVRLPQNAIESARSLGPVPETGVVFLLAAGIFVWLLRVGSTSTLARIRDGLTYVGVGLGLFFLGWSVFLGSSSIQLSATGIGNRTAGAASIGVAFVFVGVLQCLSSLASRSTRHVAFALLSALTVGAGCLVIYRVAADWGRAWAREQEVLSQVTEEFPNGFSGRTLLLDGVCQYIGPAPVFEASWDLRWALQAKYRDRTIRADVVTTNLEIREHDLRTTLYGEERLYPYGSVVAYQPASRVARTLESSADAERFFASWDADRSGGCTPGRIGNGVDIFTRADITYMGGFYDRERDQAGAEWRWMDAVGFVRLRNVKHDMALRISGRAPEQISKPPTIRITVNGQVLDTLADVTSIDKQYVVPVSAQGDGPWSDLRISTDRTFFPNEINPASEDRRRLGFVLTHLTWQAR